MGWEQRGNGLYYYQKRRVGGRVVSEYVGSDRVARLAARLDEIRRQEEGEKREGARIQRENDAEMDRLAEALADWIEKLVEVQLVAAGYHNHKGEWRRRREAKEMVREE